LGITIRISNENGEISVVLLTNSNDFNDKRIVEDIRQISCKIVSIDIFDQSKGKSRNLYGRGYIEEKLGEYSYRIYPDTFFQVNTEQTKKLYDVILKYADLKGTENALDLYCGAGTITSCLSGKAKNVIGVDSGKQSIRSAMENVQINNIKNIGFIRGNTEDVIGNIEISPDIVVMDPPRTGCDKKVLKDISNMAPEKIIYVSCNPSTLARDLKILIEYGYQCREVQPVDMFPQTEHVECCCLLYRKHI
jgi:23S rRNA (uracil1939-C5)-methyltransferase